MASKTAEKNIKVYVPDAGPEGVKLTAAALAAHLGVELTEDKDAADAQKADGLLLVYDESGLCLEGGELKMRADLMSMLPRLKQSNLEREMLIKAAKIKGEAHPMLLDATAGMGEDSLLLAAAGFNVVLYEYDPVIAALLRDALERAGQVAELAQIVNRMKLVEGDSIAAMHKIAADRDRVPDVILLDPMFPERNKSALIKKKFQLLQQLESPCDNEKELLEAAMSIMPRKIVIKRPLKGPYLADIKPGYSLSGKAIRYDVFTYSSSQSR